MTPINVHIMAWIEECTCEFSKENNEKIKSKITNANGMCLFVYETRSRGRNHFKHKFSMKIEEFYLAICLPFFDYDVRIFSGAFFQVNYDWNFAHTFVRMNHQRHLRIVDKKPQYRGVKAKFFFIIFVFQHNAHIRIRKRKKSTHTVNSKTALCWPLANAHHHSMWEQFLQWFSP